MDTKRAGKVLRELETLLIHIRVATESHLKSLREDGSEKRITAKRIDRDEYIIQYNQKKREL